LTLHHIVGDAWSIGVLVREVMALYGAFAANHPSPLAPLPIQYADYAAWQRRHLAGDTLAAQTAFWTAHLAGAPAVLELPTDRPRPAVQTFRGMAFTRELGADLSARVDALSRQLGATPFMTLLAAFGLLLGRHANQRDLVIGSPIANRTRAETEPLIGFFINTLALRTDLSGAPSFAELVARTKATTLAAYAHQDLPFEKVVEALNLPRDLSRSPLFQAMFTLQNAELPEFELAGLAARPLHLEAASAKFELSLEMTPARGGYAARWEFNADLFERATVERMAQQFETLLGTATEAADRCIDTLPLLDAAALRQLLVDWNDSAQPFDTQACVHTLFEAQACRTPEAIALVCGAETLSYHELDARADAIAARLRAHGAGPEVCVGVCLERSAELVAALLGTLKAGAAYVPMDPAYPAERLRYMLRDAACAVVLAQRSSAALFDGEAVPLLLLDAPDDHPVAAAAAAAAAAARPACADHTAYVIYTSGSTGRPKGVQVGHRAVVNFLAAMAARPGLSAADTLLAVTSVSFDIAALELYLPLAVGGRIVLADRAEAADGRRLLELAQAHGATVMQATPSTFWLMLAAGWPAALKLRALCGGEALPAALLQALRPRVGELWNMYGPTETTIWSTCRRVDGDEAPIGRPIANTVLRVLDPHGQPCPIGVAGELHIGGAGLARGYLGRPGLSAERFVPDPWGEPGSRLYRTGDAVRWLAGGELAYLGRLDQQVKLRGFRIELGEIESRLTEHPRVRQAVVALRDDRLAAYLVCDGEAPAAAELRELLGRTLPEHMIPTAFSALDHLPLTPNGKVDRKALPAPDTAAVAAPAWRAPEGETERAIAALWQQLLGLPRVGRDDDFFALGGHSLLAAQMVERLRRENGLRLALRDLFEARSLAALAARATAAGGASRHAVTLRHGAAPPLFLLHPVGGGVGPYLALAQALPESLGVVAFQAAGLDGEAAPHEAVAAMAAAYLGELLQLQPDGPVRLAGWSMGGVVAFELARQLEARGRSVEWVALLDAPSPAELAAEPAPQWPLGEYLADLALTGGQPLPLDAGRIERLLAEPQRDAHAIAAARAAGLIPETMSDALLRQRLAVFAAHRQAMRDYRPAAAIDAPLALLRAADAPAGARAACDWAGWSRGGLTVTEVPGDHYGMLLAAGAALHRLLDGAAEHRNKTLEQA
ncbi:non-ribosomal peptide synthetase, partial [Chitinimonas koreensis]